MTTALLGMEATMQYILRCAMALMLLFLSPALAQTTDDSAIAKLLHTTFDRPDDCPRSCVRECVPRPCGSKAADERDKLSPPHVGHQASSRVRACEFGFVLVAAAEPPLADGITRLLALPEKLHIAHDWLVGMVGSRCAT